MNIFTNDKGFFQGKPGGGTSFNFQGGLDELAKKFKPKPYKGMTGVCPYTGKPLVTPEEQQSGVSNEAKMMIDAGSPQFQPRMGGMM